MTTPDPKPQTDPREMLEKASRDQLLRLIEDIYKVKPWHDREPMGRA